MLALVEAPYTTPQAATQGYNYILNHHLRPGCHGRKKKEERREEKRRSKQIKKRETNNNKGEIREARRI